MAVLSVTTSFSNQFQGHLDTARARVAIGSGEGAVAPYDMLLGALASCLYATFLDIVAKKRISFESADIEVRGEKRTEVPTTLEWVEIGFRLRGASDQDGARSAVELAAKYCSIYQTLSKVARMSTTTRFD